MKKYLFLIFLFVPFISFSQSEIDYDRVGTIDNKSNLLFRARTCDAENQLNSSIFPFENRVLNQSMINTDDVFNARQRACSGVLNQSMINTDPLFNNYLMGKMILNDATNFSRIQFSPFNQGMVHPGLGYYNNIGLLALWAPIDNLFIEGSTFISLQKTPYSGEILYGIRGVLRYNLTDILQIRLWGQYISPSNNDPLKEIRGLYPKTNIGGALTTEPAKNVKVGAGVEYQHNQRNQKWESRSGGKVTFGL